MQFCEVAIVSCRSVKFLASGHTSCFCRSAATSISLPTGAGFIRERGLSACFQYPPGIEEAVKLNEFGNESCPTGLMTGAQPGAIVTMEVFIEENVVAPEWIALELFRAAVDGSSALRVAQEIRVSRPAISLLTSNRFISLPDPVGHSILKLSP